MCIRDSTKEELERPLIGVVSAYSEIVPGHMNLDKIADAVKAGVEMAGGTLSLIHISGGRHPQECKAGDRVHRRARMIRPKHKRGCASGTDPSMCIRDRLCA